MLVMRVGKMPMAVGDWNVAMRVFVPNPGEHGLAVFVPMMVVVLVRMHMLERFVRVRVFMGFGQVQPHTGTH